MREKPKSGAVLLLDAMHYLQKQEPLIIPKSAASWELYCAVNIIGYLMRPEITREWVQTYMTGLFRVPVVDL